MRRREFITVLGGAAAWPLLARAQQGERMRRVGVLISTTENDPEAGRLIAAFKQGLLELGWSEGRNVRIDVRFPADNPDRMQAFAQELVALKPDALLASGPTPVQALQRFTNAVPIVFAQVNDPVGAGTGHDARAPRRACHRFHPGGIFDWRKIAGTAQGDRTRRHRSGRDA